MGSRTPKGKGQILGVVWPFESIGSLAAVYTKTAEPTEMLLGGGLFAWAQGTVYYMRLRFQHGSGQFRGVVWSIQKHWQSLLQSLLQNGSLGFNNSVQQKE